MKTMSLNMRMGTSTTTEDGIFNCIAHLPTGREFHLSHTWRIKRRFGFLIYYRCVICGKTISKEQYNKRDGIYDILF
jgi:hypothetical protein